MSKDVQEIKVVKQGEGIAVSVKADLATSLSMLVALVLAISDKSKMDTKAIYKMLDGVTDTVEKDIELSSEEEFVSVCGPVVRWIKKRMKPIATIIIDSEGATLMEPTLKIKARKEEEALCPKEKKTA